MNYTKGEWICTCEAGYKGQVYHCPLHSLAPEMYRTLKLFIERFEDMDNKYPYSISLDLPRVWAKRVIAKVEGKK